MQVTVSLYFFNVMVARSLTLWIGVGTKSLSFLVMLDVRRYRSSFNPFHSWLYLLQKLSLDLPKHYWLKSYTPCSYSCTLFWQQPYLLLQ